MKEKHAWLPFTPHLARDERNSKYCRPYIPCAASMSGKSRFLHRLCDQGTLKIIVGDRAVETSEIRKHVFTCSLYGQSSLNTLQLISLIPLWEEETRKPVADARPLHQPALNKRDSAKEVLRPRGQRFKARVPRFFPRGWHPLKQEAVVHFFQGT